MLNCNYSLLTAFSKHLKGPPDFVRKVDIETEICGELNWHNLAKWCQNTRLSITGCSTLPKNAELDKLSSEVVVMAATHDLARTVVYQRDYERAMLNLRMVACKLDNRWR